MLIVYTDKSLVIEYLLNLGLVFRMALNVKIKVRTKAKQFFIYIYNN